MLGAAAEEPDDMRWLIGGPCACLAPALAPLLTSALVLAPGLARAAGDVVAAPPEPTAVDELQSCRRTGVYRNAALALGEADIAVNRRDLPRALKVLDAAIEALPPRLYDFQGLNDDTGLALTAAGLEQKAGRPENAFHLKMGVLESRLDGYCWKRAHPQP
jgi:hypothetical protein